MTDLGGHALYLYPRMREANETLIRYNEGMARNFLDTRRK